MYALNYTYIMYFIRILGYVCSYRSMLYCVSYILSEYVSEYVSYQSMYLIRICILSEYIYQNILEYVSIRIYIIGVYIYLIGVYISYQNISVLIVDSRRESEIKLCLGTQRDFVPPSWRLFGSLTTLL